MEIYHHIHIHIKAIADFFSNFFNIHSATVIKNRIKIGTVTYGKSTGVEGTLFPLVQRSRDVTHVNSKMARESRLNDTQMRANGRGVTRSTTINVNDGPLVWRGAVSIGTIEGQVEDLLDEVGRC